jgi:hypothetical protein
MPLNTKLFFLLLFSAITICNAQETIVENDDFNDDPETVFFNFEIFRPVGIGDSFLARDYNIGAGFAFDFNWFFVPNFTVGTHFNIFRSSVENQSAVGNIQSTSVAMFGLTAGYYYEVDQHWNVHATAGFGTLNYRNTAPEDKFSEPGTSYWVQVQVAYRFNKTVAVYFKMEPRLDKLEIQAPPGLDQYFNRHFMLNPGLGLRLNFHNPGG